MKPRTIFWLISAFQLFSLSAFQALAQPTNPIASAPANLRPLSVTTNAALFGIGTNLFWTNLSLIRAAGIVAPTNAGTLGYVPVYKAAGAFAWEAQSGSLSQTNIAVAGVTNAGTMAYTNATTFLTFLDGLYLSLPTNAPTDGYHLEATGTSTRWVLSDSGSGDGIDRLNGFGTNTTLYFNNAGWGTNQTISGNTSNSVISGGLSNTLAGASGSARNWGGTIGGGFNNSISASGGFMEHNTIGGGAGNAIGGIPGGATIGGGLDNHISSSGAYSADSAVIAGGTENTIGTGGTGISSAVGGGTGNTVDSPHAVIAGGEDNHIASTPNNFSISSFSAILGGSQNIVSNDSPYAVILGGRNNVAWGTNSLASGRRAQATNVGAYVFTDNQDAAFTSTTNNQFILRFHNGLAINTNSAGTNALKVAGNVDATGFSINGTPISLVGGGGGGAGFLSNGVAALVMDTWYTNTTEYYLHVSATLDMSASSGVNAAAVEFARDDEPDGTDDYNKRMTLTASADSVSTFATMELSSWVAPGGAFRYWDISDGAGAASFYSDVDLLYVGAGGGTSANQTNVTIYSTPSTADTLILRSDAIEYAVFNPTNIALESTVVTIPSPVLNSGNYTNTATVHLRTNAAPANVTVGTTPPDVWLPIAGTNGTIYYVPGWTPH